MAIRSANAKWEGDLKAGKGSIKFAGGGYEGPYSFASRFEDGRGTNPEELIAAAHAGCYSMALSHTLAEAGHKPTSVETTAKVHLEKQGAGFGIPRIDLITKAVVPGISEDQFNELAETAKVNCPVSKVLAGAEITLSATLTSA